MHKVLVETTGNFQILTQRKGEVIKAFRPSIVYQCHTVGFHAARGDLKVYGEVADTASDEELATFLQDGGTAKEYFDLHAPVKEPEPATKAKGPRAAAKSE